jgi:hypothetical protein
MRDFFINSFEILVGVIIVLLALGVVIFAGFVAFGGGHMGSDAPNGPLAALLILIVGGLYVIFVGGLMYLGLGIHQNTKRTAAAVEKLASR